MIHVSHRFVATLLSYAKELCLGLDPVLAPGARGGAGGEDVVQGWVGGSGVGGEGVFDDAGDVGEAEVAGEEVLNGHLVCGAEDGGEGAAAAAGFQGQAEAGGSLPGRAPGNEGPGPVQGPGGGAG